MRHSRGIDGQASAARIRVRPVRSRSKQPRTCFMAISAWKASAIRSKCAALMCSSKDCVNTHRHGHIRRCKPSKPSQAIISCLLDLAIVFGIVIDPRDRSAFPDSVRSVSEAAGERVQNTAPPCFLLLAHISAVLPSPEHFWVKSPAGFNSSAAGSLRRGDQEIVFVYGAAVAFAGNGARIAGSGRPLTAHCMDSIRRRQHGRSFLRERWSIVAPARSSALALRSSLPSSFCQNARGNPDGRRQPACRRVLFSQNVNEAREDYQLDRWKGSEGFSSEAGVGSSLPTVLGTQPTWRDPRGDGALQTDKPGFPPERVLRRRYPAAAGINASGRR